MEILTQSTTAPKIIPQQRDKKQIEGSLKYQMFVLEYPEYIMDFENQQEKEGKILGKDLNKYFLHKKKLNEPN